MKIIVIGGGAGGFFAALACAELLPQSQVILLEKSNKLLSKVRVSGGGRCNVTHACFQLSDLVKCYPRGGPALKKVLGAFMPQDTIAWFEQRGLALKTEADGRMFPQSDSSESVIACFLKEAQKLGLQIHCQEEVKSIERQATGFRLLTAAGKSYRADKVIVATGGSPKLQGLDWLATLGHRIVPPVPSLFTFNLPKEPITALMGVAVPEGRIRIQKSKIEQSGAILITHWGLSGPAVLKASAWGARFLSEATYDFGILVSWIAQSDEEQLRALCLQYKNTLATRQVGNRNPFKLPKRLWEFLVERIGLDKQKTWAALSKAELNRLINVLLNDAYEVQGKTTFKEEFVTCGGLSLEDIDMRRMESKLHPGLFFTGEVLDIDGITGGFNFQAAWATATAAARAIAAEG